MKEFFRNFIIPVLSGLLIFFVVNLIFHPCTVYGESMEPTYSEGDVVLCKKMGDEINVGDVVVIKEYSLKYLVKRVVALPGDEVVIEDGVLYVNGEKSEYNYMYIENPGVFDKKVVLDNEQYVCLGDNRNVSRDCRAFGPITKDKMIYKVIKTLIHNPF